VISVATLTAYIIAIAQPVAAECERDRLRAHGDTTSIVLESAMPKPSRARAEAWAMAAITDPLFKGDPRTEAIFGLLWAESESLYNDRAVADGGASGCSLGVWASFHAVTVAQLQDDPPLCIAIARKVMRWSFVRNPEHPMAQYSGSAFDARSIAVADRRNAIVKRLIAKLPPLVETPS